VLEDVSSSVTEDQHVPASDHLTLATVICLCVLSPHMRAVEVVTLLASLTVNVVVLSSHPLLVVLTGALLLLHPECGLRGYVEIARTTWGFKRGIKNHILMPSSSPLSP